MKKFVGVWLDHRQAYLVYLFRDQAAAEDNEMIEGLKSNMERRVRLSGGARTRKTPYGPQDIAVDGKQESRIRSQLAKYYKNIIDRIADADQVMVFGPGEAKIELKKAAERSGRLDGKIRKIETADKMTVKQIAARVRKFFISQS